MSGRRAPRPRARRARRRIRCAPGRTPTPRSMRTRWSCAGRASAPHCGRCAGRPGAGPQPPGGGRGAPPASARTDRSRTVRSSVPAPAGIGASGDRAPARRQRRRDLGGAGQRPLEAALRHLARRGKAEPAARCGDANADALVAYRGDALNGAAAHREALRDSADPSRLGVRAPRGRACDEVAQEVEWRQPVAPVEPVDALAPVEPSAPGATVAPLTPVDPAGGWSPSRSITKTSVALGGIAPCPFLP